MADLTVTEADLKSLSSALVRTSTDLEALQSSLRHMDVASLGAPPLIEEEAALTRTRDRDLTSLGEGMTSRRDEVERVIPKLRETDRRLERDNVQRGK